MTKQPDPGSGRLTPKCHHWPQQGPGFFQAHHLFSLFFALYPLCHDAISQFKWILHQVSNFDQNFFDYALSHFFKNPKRFSSQASCSVSKTARKLEAGCIHTDKPFKMCPSCHFPSKTHANTHTDTLFKTNGLLFLVSISYWTIFFLILS